MAGCRLFVGLGNPGRRYEKTRHCAGFWFLESLAQRYSASWSASGEFLGDVAKADVCGHAVFLLKPSTYMNHSGRSVGALARYYKIAPEEILVAHDELDFDAGVVKLKKGGGHGGHNGLRDVVAHLGSHEFLRLRIGIGHPGSKEEVVGYVLSNPLPTERQAIDARLDDAVDIVQDLVAGRYEQAVNVLHAGSMR